MIRKLTEHDITAIVSANVKGYVIEKVRIKFGSFTDSDPLRNTAWQKYVRVRHLAISL